MTLNTHNNKGDEVTQDFKSKFLSDAEIISSVFTLETLSDKSDFFMSFFIFSIKRMTSHFSNHK